MDPVIETLIADLTAAAARNSATTIATRLSTIKQNKQNTQTINGLTEIINELVKDREELVSISLALKEQLVSQQISEDEIKHVTETVIPIINNFTESGIDESTKNNIEQLKALLSTDVLAVLQTLGFNYRAAIGEPLTLLLRSFILAKSNEVDQRQKELKIEELRFQKELLRTINDPDAYERYKEINR